MPTYSIQGNDGKTYSIEGPEGATETEVISAIQTELDQEEKTKIQEEYQVEMARINAVPEVVEEDDGGFLDAVTPDQLEEFLKGLGGGAAGLLESAALGAITPFAEETESSLRDTIQGIADPVQDFFSADKGSEDLVGRKLGEGVGSFLGILGAAAIPGVGLPLAAGLAVGAGAGEASERAREGDATEDERGTASLFGAAVGATELFTPLRMIKTFKKAIGETGSDQFFDKVKRIVTEAGVEGAQEFVAGVGQNLIEKGIYNPEQGTFEGGTEQFGMGAGVGGFVQAVFEIVTPRKRGGSDTTPIEEKPVVKAPTTKVLKSKTKVPDPFDSSDIQEQILKTQPKGSYNPNVNEETPTTVKTSANVGARFTTDSEGATTDTDSVLASAQKLIDGGADLEDLSSAQKEALAKKYNIKFKKDTAPKQEKKKAPDNESTVIDPYPDITEETMQNIIDNNPNDLQAQELAREALAIKQKVKKQRDSGLGAPGKDDVFTKKEIKGKITELKDLNTKGVGTQQEQSNRTEELKDLNTQLDTYDKTFNTFKGVVDPDSDVDVPTAQETTTTTQTSVLTDVQQKDIQDGLNAKKSRKQIFDDTFGAVGTSLGLTQTKYKAEIKNIADQQKQKEADARAVEVGKEADRFNATLTGEQPVITRLKQDAAKLTEAGSQKRISEEIANLNKATAKKKNWSNVAQNFGEKYKEIVPDKKDPVSVNDKFRIQKLLITTVPEQSGKDKDKPENKSNREAKEFISRFERPIDAFLTAGYETVFPSEVTTKQTTGLMTAEKQFFSAINGKTGENLVRWVNKNLDAKTKTFVQDYINEQRQVKFEQVKKENRYTRRVQSLTKSLVKEGKFKDIAETLYGEGSKKKTLTVQDFLDYQKIKRRAKEEEKAASADLKTVTLSSEDTSVINKLADVIKPPARQFKQNLKSRESYRDKKVVALKKSTTKRISPDLKTFLAMDVKLVNKMIKQGILTDANLSPPEYIELIDKRPNIDFDALELSEANTNVSAAINKAENELLPTEKVEGLDDPISPIVVALAKKGDLKGVLQAIQNTTNSSLVVKMAAALEGSLGNTKLKVQKTLISDAKVEVSGVYNIKDDTIALDSETGINIHTILHEATHAITQKTLDNKSHPLTKQLKTIFNDTKGMLDTAYGAESVKDFVAEAMSNPVFRQKLAGINPKGEPLSALEKFVNAIGNFLRKTFRLPSRAPGGSALTQVDLLVDGLLAPTPGARGTGDLTASSMIGQVEDLKTYLSNRANSVDNSDSAKKGFVNRIADMVENQELATKIKTFGLYGLPLQAIDDISQKFPGLGPAASKLRKAIEAQVGLTNKMDERIDGTLNVFDNWLNKNPDKKITFDKLVAESTRSGIDPSNLQSKYKNDKVKFDAWVKLNKQYQLLGEDGQNIYKEMRDVYSSIYEQLKIIVGAKIDEAITDKAEATKMKKTAFKIMFDKTSIEPYFPLARKGDYWMAYTAMNPETNTTEPVYEAFESVTARRARAAELDGDSRIVDPPTFYKNLNDIQFNNASPSGGLVKDILAIVEKQLPKNRTKQDQAAFNATKEELMELFIAGLPETSFARSMQKRGGEDGQGLEGFNKDSFDVFRTKAYDMSRQVARMQSSNEIRKIEAELREGYKKNGSKESTLLVLEELLERAKFSRSPPVDMKQRLAGNANRIAFLGTIGFNLSSAIVNASQIPLMMLPILQGKYSKTGNAFKSISFASGIITSSGFSRKVSRVDFKKDKVDVKGMPSIDNYFESDDQGNLTLRKDIDLSEMSEEKREFIENDLKALVKLAGDRGGLNRSLYYDTLGIEQAGRTRTIWDKANAYSAFSFHQIERYNRQVAMTATYQLELQRMEKNPTAEEKGMSIENRRAKAAEQAIYQSQEMNGGATLSTAPRIAQTGLGRVALMYKSYGIQMYYTMFKTLDTALKGESKEVRTAAKKQLFGIVLSSTLLAGVSGLPLIGALMAIANLFLDDEEDDAETILRKEIGEFAYKGPITALIGTDISSRISLSNLLFRDNPYNNDASDADLLMGIIGGPAWSVGQSFSRGVTDVYAGNIERGVEAMLPAAFRNIYKATYRYPRDEGILTRRGDVIHDDISTGGLFAQFVGFPPTDYTLKQEQNQQLKKIDRAVNERRTKLLKQFYVATRMGANTDDILKEMEKYNKRHPQHGINGKSILRSMKMHYLSSAKMHNGVTLSPKNRTMLLDHMNEYDPY